MKVSHTIESTVLPKSWGPTWSCGTIFPSSLTYNLSSPPSHLVSCPSKGISFSWQMSNCSVQCLLLLQQLRHNCLSALGFTCLLSSWLQHSWKTLCVSAALTFFCRLAAMNSSVISLLRFLLISPSSVPLEFHSIWAVQCAMHNNKGAPYQSLQPVMLIICRILHQIVIRAYQCPGGSQFTKILTDMCLHGKGFVGMSFPALFCNQHYANLSLPGGLSSVKSEQQDCPSLSIQYRPCCILQLAACNFSFSWRVPLALSLSCKTGQA